MRLGGVCCMNTSPCKGGEKYFTKKIIKLDKKVVYMYCTLVLKSIDRY